MDYILKDLGVCPQVCETMKQKGITKQTFLEIINSNAGNSYQMRVDLSKMTGLQIDKIMAICDRIRMEKKNSQQLTSSVPTKQNFTSSSSTSSMMKPSSIVGAPQSSKRISALLKQPANKPIQSSSQLKLLQSSSFAVKKPNIPQSTSVIIKAENIEQKFQEEVIVQIKIEPMKSPTEVRTILMDTTVADSGDSANAPSEGELHSAPAQFVTAAPVLEQVSPIAELQKDVGQGLSQIFAESDTESELTVKEYQQEAEFMHKESIENAEKAQQLEDDQQSLSSSEDEMLMKYQSQQVHLNLNKQFKIEIEEYSQSSSSSGTLSPIHSNLATQKDQIVEQESSDEENIQMNQSDQQIAIQHQDGPSMEEGREKCSASDDNMDILEAPSGFIIKGLDERDNQNEDQMHREVQDHIMQEPDENVHAEISEEEKNDYLEIQEPLNVHQETVQEQKNEAQGPISQIGIEAPIAVLQKVGTVDMGMQCEPWEPQVVYVEPEKKSMKNKKLQVTQEKIEKSFKSPNSQQDEEKSSPIQQNDEKKKDSSSGNKGNYSASKTFVPGRTLIIPTVKQFSQSSVRTSSVQTTNFHQDQELSLSQLLEDTDFKSQPTQYNTYSQIVPKVKPILKRFHHEREDDSYTQLDSKRVKWDPNVEEKTQKPGEESYLKRFMFQKKKQQRQALHQAQAIDSLSSDEENQFYDEDEEEQEEEEIVLQRPHPKRRKVFVSKNQNDIKRETSSEDEEEEQRRDPKTGNGSKVRHNWANEIKNWLNDMSGGKRSSSSQ